MTTFQRFFNIVQIDMTKTFSPQRRTVPYDVFIVLDCRYQLTSSVQLITQIHFGKTITTKLATLVI